MSKIYFVGPLASELLEPSKEVSLAALSWFTTLYEVVEERKHGIGLTIRYDKSWPLGRLAPKYAEVERPRHVSGFCYLNIRGIRSVTILLSLAWKLYRDLSRGEIHRVVFYNKFWGLAHTIRFLRRKFDNIEFDIMLLDLEIEETLPAKDLSYLREFTRVYSCSAWLVEKLKELGLEAFFFAGGLSDLEVKNTPLVQRTVFYGGKYDAYGGINLILDSIERIPENKYSWLFSGKIESSRLLELASRRSDIKLLGVLTRKDYLDVVQSAQIRIIPGETDWPSFKTNFPSKIWDYLNSRGAIISVNYPAYTREIESLITIIDNTPDSLIKALANIEVRDIDSKTLEKLSIYKTIEVFYE